MNFAKTHYASIGLIVLGIAQILLGSATDGIHSILLGLAAFNIHSAVLATQGSMSHPLLNALWPLLSPVLAPPAPTAPLPKPPATIAELMAAVQPSNAVAPTATVK
jgi:hypothetical protein